MLILHIYYITGLVTRLRRPPAQLLPSQLSSSSTFDEKWEIDKNTLMVGKKIGSGQFGVCVYNNIICYIANNLHYIMFDNQQVLFGHWCDGLLFLCSVWLKGNGREL